MDGVVTQAGQTEAEEVAGGGVRTLIDDAWFRSGNSQNGVHKDDSSGVQFWGTSSGSAYSIWNISDGPEDQYLNLPVEDSGWNRDYQIVVRAGSVDLDTITLIAFQAISSEFNATVATRATGGDITGNPVQILLEGLPVGVCTIVMFRVGGNLNSNGSWRFGSQESGNPAFFTNP